MFSKLLSHVRDYLKYAIATPLFMLLEVAMEMVIPLLMASIIDDGINAGNMTHILVVGAEMLAAAAVGLFAGIMGGRYGAYASAGLAKNLRQGMFEKIQTYSFSNIDKFSTNSLITRLTTDVTSVQNASSTGFSLLNSFTLEPFLIRLHKLGIMFGSLSGPTSLRLPLASSITNERPL